MKRLKLITSPDANAKQDAQKQWNGVAKPLHSLGLLEETIIKIAGITHSADVLLDKRCVVLMCADNGVVNAGVAQTDSSVTRIVAEAAADGKSNINLMAKTCKADVFTVDIGMNTDSMNEKIIRRKIAYGTENIANGAAMTEKDAEMAVSAGIDMVGECVSRGYKIIVTGEMGIGNTTTSSAIASVLLGEPAAMITGRGAGLDADGYKRKIAAIENAIAVNHPDRSEPLGLISKLGGFDIAGMTGLFLGGAVYDVPIVADGFISSVSAALAVGINPLVKEYILCSHVSREPAGIKLLDYIGLKPLISAELCLGEGTGGVLLLPMLDAALAVYHSAHRFDSLPMKKYEELV